VSRNDRTVTVWDAATGRKTRTLNETDPWVCFSPDGKRYVSSSVDGRLKICDATTGQESLVLQAILKEHGPVAILAWSGDSKRIAGAFQVLSKQGVLPPELVAWDAATGQQVLVPQHTGKGITCVAFSPDGKRLVSGSGDGTMTIWETSTGQVTLTFQSGVRIVSAGDALRVWE
jgi:WD40 repeat protein